MLDDDNGNDNFLFEYYTLLYLRQRRMNAGCTWRQFWIGLLRMFILLAVCIIFCLLLILLVQLDIFN